MKRIFLPAVAVLALAVSACTHSVHSDYAQYLVNNETQVTFPHVTESVQYYMDPTTENHSMQVRAITTGIANSWVVDFGRILDATMSGNDMRTAFDEVKKVSSPEGVPGLLLRFSLRRYDFSDFQATVALGISARNDGTEILTNTYSATGISQGGKMFWGGAFAMQNAMQQSTKSALDQIFTEFIGDLKKRWGASG